METGSGVTACRYIGLELIRALEWAIRLGVIERKGPRLAPGFVAVVTGSWRCRVGAGGGSEFYGACSVCDIQTSPGQEPWLPSAGQWPDAAGHLLSHDGLGDFQVGTGV